MNSSKRVLVASLFHETHTFVPGETTLADCAVLRGDEILACAGDASVVDGGLEVAAARGWQLVPALDIRAMPGATISDDVVETWWDVVRATVGAAPPLDGVFLALHGAMASRSLDDVEGEVLERLRALIGPDVPICGVTDLHANFSARMAANTDVLVTYRENPHIDGRETAVRSAEFLDHLMENRLRATTLFQQTAMMWPPTGTATATDPMLTLERLAREAEAAHEEILAINVHAGYSFADVHDAGVSFSACTTGDPAIARQVLGNLAATAWKMRDAGNPVEPSFEALWPDIQRALTTPGTGPVVIAEPSDNIGGGAGGDGTGLLRDILRHEVSNAAVVICDPVAVARLAPLAPGSRENLPIGGASAIPGAGPLELEVEVVSSSDGKFTLEDEHSHLSTMMGKYIDMGPCVTVKHTAAAYATVWVLLTSLKIPPFDLGQLRSQGIVPEQMALIGAKAAVAHRRAYDSIARASFTVATPGVCSSDLKLLPFKNVRRPIFPLDSIV